jgi:hypothetical protein
MDRTFTPPAAPPDYHDASSPTPRAIFQGDAGRFSALMRPPANAGTARGRHAEGVAAARTCKKNRPVFITDRQRTAAAQATNLPWTTGDNRVLSPVQPLGRSRGLSGHGEPPGRPQPSVNATAPRTATMTDHIAPAVALRVVADDDPLWLPSVDMARMVGCHPRTLRRWANKGLIPAPAMTAARSRRWPVREVLAALEASRAITPL